MRNCMCVSYLTMGDAGLETNDRGNNGNRLSTHNRGSNCIMLVLMQFMNNGRGRQYMERTGSHHSLPNTIYRILTSGLSHHLLMALLRVPCRAKCHHHHLTMDRRISCNLVCMIRQDQHTTNMCTDRCRRIKLDTHILKEITTIEMGIKSFLRNLQSTST